MTSPDTYPLLMLPQAVRADRQALPQARGGRQIRRPSPEEQGRRLSGRWEALESAIQERRASVATDVRGQDPQLVLVLEMAGRLEDFSRAVARIPGMEFLAEIDEEAIQDQEEIFAYEDGATNPIPGTLYLLASNQQALSAVLALWQLYQRDESASFPYGQTRWREVFQHLIDVRPWSAADRLRGTGALEDFSHRVAQSSESVPAELELWYRAGDADRSQAEARVRAAVAAVAGEVLAAADIGEIGYHALLVQLPVEAVSDVLEGDADDVALLRVEDLAFVRPQSLLGVVADGDVVSGQPASPSPGPATDDPPLVGILDGVPLSNHVTLTNHLIVDDPDDLQAGAQAGDRLHGTGIASLVIHDDLAAAAASLNPDPPMKSCETVRPSG